ncbi:hypothetical protein [Peijinzhouia sedimentorum]
MIKKILIPTDFSIQSLNVLKSALNDLNEGDKVDILMVHGMYTSSNITSLLYFSKKEIIDTVASDSFRDACQIIKSKYSSKINSMREEIFTGFTQAAFSNFVEGNRIDEAVIPQNYQMQLENKKSFDVTPFIRRSQIKVSEVSWKNDIAAPERGQLAEVFVGMANG